MTFDQCLQEQARLHPAMAPQDAVKLCYQAAHGAEHLLKDAGPARALLMEEFGSVSPRSGMLVEVISPAYARVNLAVWKHRGLAPEALFELFKQTAARPARDAEDTLHACFDTVEKRAAQGLLPFTQSAWRACLAAYRLAGGGPVRHSEGYRQQEQPHYRVVSRALLRAFSG